MATPLTRREVLKGAAVGLSALGAGATRAGPAQAAKRARVAVIGAGAGGVAAAYFLAGTYDVDVFEARSRIGGHCDSRTIDYVTLLEELRLYDPANPNSRQTRVSPGSLPKARLPAGADAANGIDGISYDL